MEDVKRGVLESIFENVNKWLQWGEAKNAAIFAGNIALLIGIQSVIFDNQCAKSNLYTISLSAGIVLIVLSSLACLVSFYPRLTKVTQFKKQDSNSNSESNTKSNDIFFVDCSKYESGQEYLDALVNKLHGEISDETKQPIPSIENDYACEIITNSKICNFKYRCFRASSLLCFTGILCFGLSQIFKLLRI